MTRDRVLLTVTVAVFCGLIATAQTPPPQPAPTAPAQTPGAPPPGRGGGRGGPAVVSPQIESDGRVTFRVLAPNATTVTAGGDINGSLVPDPAAPAPQSPAWGSSRTRGWAAGRCDDQRRERRLERHDHPPRQARGVALHVHHRRRDGRRFPKRERHDQPDAGAEHPLRLRRFFGNARRAPRDRRSRPLRGEVARRNTP